MNITITQYIERDRDPFYIVEAPSTSGKIIFEYCNSVLTKAVEEAVKENIVDTLPAYLSEVLYQRVIDVLVDGLIDETPIRTIYLGDYD